MPNRKKPAQPSDDAEHLRDLLESTGWSVASQYFSRSLGRHRSRIFNLSNKDDVVSEIRGLQIFRDIMNEIYRAAGAELPSWLTLMESN